MKNYLGVFNQRPYVKLRISRADPGGSSCAFLVRIRNMRNFFKYGIAEFEEILLSNGAY